MQSKVLCLIILNTQAKSNSILIHLHYLDDDKWQRANDANISREPLSDL